ncbi:hypothetical protein [Devosia lacusdianchii]|uniref:hypothetical protein n=1 Tax=Devosia lacusdianchii TaxID=2917991 RepID=UPI001F05A70F|nr:hypothetical protein [Devosia sp. JXJ CY 41]
MRFSLMRSAVAGLVLFCTAGTIQAADLAGGYRGACVSYSQSDLANQSPDVIRQTVWSNLDNAKSAMNEPSVLASTRPSFVWAMEARWACEAAAGYLETGHFDTASIQKCDCFYQRHLSFR